MTFKKIAVIGAGTMGSGIAHVCAQHGFAVALADLQVALLDRALTTIAANLDRMVAKNTIATATKEETLSRISVSTSIRDAVADADIVVEAISEDLSLKTALFRELDTLCRPEVVLATNTSSISITAIAGATRRPDKVIGMHFMNPVPLMTLVEVIRGHATSTATVQLVKSLCDRLEKTPVEVMDYPGFVANRILMPMLNEAMFAVMEGVATPAAVDTVMKLGMNHPMGPLALADFIGLYVCLSIMNVLHEGFGDPKYRPCPLLKRMVAAGDLGRKSGRGFYSYT